jgi:lysozyme
MNPSRALLAVALACPVSAGAQVFFDSERVAETIDGIKSLAARSGAARSLAVPAIRLPVPDPPDFPVRGVDVSFYQGNVQWEKVAAAGIAFAFIKATQNVDHVDTAFARNWEGAGAAGLPRGAYHFYSLCKDGDAQAANFIARVPRDPRALAEVVDVEFSNDCAHAPSKEEFLAQFSVFVARLEAAYGRLPMIYTNKQVYGRYLKEVAGRHKIWIADPHGTAPETPAGLAWTFWQYSFRGRVDGIEGDVDLNAFNGTREQFAGLIPSAVVSYASFNR